MGSWSSAESRSERTKKIRARFDGEPCTRRADEAPARVPDSRTLDMIVLAADTSTALGSVALLEGEDLVAETRLQMGRGHSESLLPAVEGLLALKGWTLQNIDLMCVGLGPGSFTGLRIGVVTMRMLGYALGIEVRGASSLEAICAAWRDEERVIVSTLDAFKGEIYAGAFRASQGRLEPLGEEAVLPPESLAERIRQLAEANPVVVLGPGSARYRNRLGDLGSRVLSVPEAMPSASGVARCVLRKEKAPEPIVPHYVRKSEAELTWSLKHPA